MAKTLDKILKIGAVAMGCVSIAALAGAIYIAVRYTPKSAAILEEVKLSNKLSNTYRQALVKYADTNKDGFISSDERDAFDRDLFKDKAVVLASEDLTRGVAPYKDGEEVPAEQVIEWIQNYKP